MGNSNFNIFSNFLTRVSWFPNSNNEKKCYFCKTDLKNKKAIRVSVYFCETCYNNQKKKMFDIERVSKSYSDYNMITDKIYLGNSDTAKDKELLKDRGITHILVCGYFLHKFHPDDFIYKVIEIDDCLTDRIDKYFKECIEFIESSHKVYVHCRAGISRSSSIVIAFMMWKHKLSYEDAKNLVQDKRDCISPNPNFEEQLKEFELQLRKNYYEL